MPWRPTPASTLRAPPGRSATRPARPYTTTGGVDYAAPTSTYGAYTDAPAGGYTTEASYPTETTYGTETTSVEYADRGGDPTR